jgi:hypothetical protein
MATYWYYHYPLSPVAHIVPFLRRLVQQGGRAHSYNILWMVVMVKEDLLFR